MSTSVGRGGRAGRPSARDALVVAMIGEPTGEGLPHPADVDLAAFWPRFEAAAPFHLAAGFRIATVVIATVLPRLLGHGKALAALEPDAADRVVRRAAGLPVASLLADVAKIVACFAYLSDPRVQAAERAPEPHAPPAVESA